MRLFMIELEGGLKGSSGLIVYVVANSIESAIARTMYSKPNSHVYRITIVPHQLLLESDEKLPF